MPARPAALRRQRRDHERGPPLEVVGKMLGHKNYRTTQRYAHIADYVLRDAVNLTIETIVRAGRSDSKARRAPPGRPRRLRQISVVSRALATAGARVKEDNVIRFHLTRTPRPLFALPPADDPDLPVPRSSKKLAASPGAAEAAESAERTEVLAVSGATVCAGPSVEASGADLALPISAPLARAAVEKDD